MGGEPEKEVVRGWRIWKGVTGWWYARRLKTSPPPVIRQPTREDLLAEVEQRERDHERRYGQ